MKYSSITSKLLLSSALISMGATAYAQDAPTTDDEIIAVGTQIKGSDIAGILPVTSLNAEDIEITGAVSGDELLAAIPQLGDVNFTETNFGAGVNDARGDVGSVNLRGVGDGNTLVLLNGRRLVNHPGTKAVNQTPVVTVNSNALPVTGIKRMEILRDGASAVYGTDAVAGVINTILDTNYEGLQVQLQYGASEGTSLNETSGTLKWGKSFNDGRTNFSLFANAMLREGMPASDLRNSAQEDLRPFFVGTPYEGNTSLRNISIDSPFGTFRTLSGGQAAGIGDNDFHVQPLTEAGCLTGDLGGGICADNSSSVATNLRLDRSGFRDIVGDTDRYNLFGYMNHDLANGMEFFGEASYYQADYTRRRETAQILSSQRYQVTLPTTAFYNPFGEDISIGRLRPIDAGQRSTNVFNDSFRLLGGLRGQWNAWDWETALVHSEATTEDHTNRVSLSLFQDAISRTDSSAYNPFAAGNATDINLPGTFNNQDTIDSFVVEVTRDSQTKLTLADFKTSNPALFSIPGGNIGAALGVEWRREEYSDDRDNRLDGTTTFTDDITGVTLGSDVMGSSPTPDTNGERDVFSAFVELAVPVVSPDMAIPLVHSFDVQLAARAEDYSDVGGVVKPKVAASWFPFEPFQIRAAYSEGFRAPNLEQINATAIRRVNTGREDFILCHVLTGPNFTSDDDCDSVGVEGIRSGGPDLDPEESKNWSLGATYEPVSGLTFTLDWWRIEQEGLVGLLSDQNEISLDYLLRLNNSFNPNVLRATPDAALAAQFVAAGLDGSGAGEIIGVAQPFKNLDTRESEGMDFSATYRLDTDYGRFNFKANVAKLEKLFQSPSPQGQQLTEAVNAGSISPLVGVVGENSLIRQEGNPELRYTGSITWKGDNWGAGAFYKYVDDVVDLGVRDANGIQLPVDSFNTLSLYADYSFKDLNEGNLFEDVRLRFGVRNIEDNKPPITDDFARHYNSKLHSNRGRYFYGSVRKTF